MLKDIKLFIFGIVVLLSLLCYMPLVADAARSERKPPAVDAEQYADFMASQPLDIKDLADEAEIQRDFFNRITPPHVSLFQPMMPMVRTFNAADFTDDFLEGLLGEDRNSVTVYPLSFLLDPKTRETLIYNAEDELIASVPPLWGPRIEQEGSEAARVTLFLELLPLEDVEQYLYTETRVFQTLLSIARKPKRDGGMSQKSMGCGSNEFGIVNIQKLTNGAMRITVSEGTNEINIAEMFAYTVEHTSSVSGSITLWTPVTPSFNGLESDWVCQTTNLVLTNGVGVWEDSNISSNDRVRFYGVAKRIDTDTDALTDGAEIFLYTTDPNNADSDEDGLCDGTEVNEQATDPNNSDTDGDGMPDGWEVQNGLDPRDDGTTNSVNGAEGDLDGDGFNNALEYELGAPANNPAWNGNELAYRLTHVPASTRSITTNLIGMRVDIEDSATHCGGSNDCIQSEVDPLVVPDMLASGYYIDVTIKGAVEDHMSGYDKVHFQAFTNAYYFEGNNNYNGCDMDTKTLTKNVLILQNTTVQLRYDTIGHKYHVDAYAEIINAIKTGVLNVELKVTHPAPSPTGSAAKYSNDPSIGSADNLFSTWPNEQFRVRVNIEPVDITNSMPSGFIHWTAEGFTIPDNTTEFTFSWGSTGVKDITVEVPSYGITKEVYIDVPNVGILSQAAAAALVGPVAAALITNYGLDAIDYANNTFPVGPQRDAFRHAYWNSLSVSHVIVTEQQSLLVTTGHEHDNRDDDVPRQQAFNSTMDLHNNLVGANISHTTLLGTPDKTAIQTDINQQYANGALWIWDGGGAQENSEGILVKSDRAKIYSN